MTGLRPVVDIMFGDFITLTVDQVVNQGATLGATRRSAAQQSLHPWFSHAPGLEVVLPSTPYDAKGLAALGAAVLLEELAISAQIIDPRTIWPLDEKTLIESAKKTSRVIVMDQGYGRYGVTAKIASVVADRSFLSGDAGEADGGHVRPDSIFTAFGRCRHTYRANGFWGSSGPQDPKNE